MRATNIVSVMMAPGMQILRYSMYLLGCSTGPKAMHPKPASAGMHGAPRYPLLRPRSGVAGGTTAASKGCSSQRSVCAARDASRPYDALLSGMHRLMVTLLSASIWPWTAPRRSVVSADSAWTRRSTARAFMSWRGPLQMVRSAASWRVPRGWVVHRSRRERVCAMRNPTSSPGRSSAMSSAP